MKKIGIICEYNPFHNGHLYHIKQIKKLYPNSLIILVLNGYFTERGEISIQSKESKTHLALDHGIDLVLELPVIYGTQSSDTFAYKSIEILNHFQIDTLIFGSESNHLETLKNIANNQNTEEFNTNVKQYLSSGLNYPTALAKSSNTIINSPNDLLAISYLKAINQINPQITPISIQRTNSYHDLTSQEPIISASNLRNKLKNQEPISSYLPPSSLSSITTYNEQTLFNLLKTKIITSHNLNTYLTVDEGLDNRLRKTITKVTTIEELIKSCKSKRYTYNKISRMLIHILLSLLKTHATTPLSYIKILGFTTLGQNYLNQIKKEITIPTKPIKTSLQYHYETTASIIYDILTTQNTYSFETSNKPITKN